MKALGIIFLGLLSVQTSYKARICTIQNTGKYPDKYSDPPVYQVIISEIMADPVPHIGLPGIEYIEIFNREATAIDLTGWKLIIGSHEKVIPSAIIEPGEFRIICEPEADSLFTGFGKTLPISNMPAILNSGQVITLKNHSGVLIHTVAFSDRWYITPNKANGGWSLEIIDPHNPCGGAENWSESIDARGGSPGIINSVDAHNPDNQPPIFMRATVSSDSSVKLHFSEPMELASLTSPWQYSVNNGLLHPTDVYPIEPNFTTTVLTYPVQFNPDCYYTLTILNILEDCAGNRLAPNAAAHFAISQASERNDLVINEILFSPSGNMSEFIELYNRSKKVLDLSGFSIALADNETGLITKTVSFNKNPFILFPASYVVISGDTRNLPLNSFFVNPSVMIEQSDMFALPDEEGFVVLLDTSLQTIDEFHYNRFVFNELLSDPEGVSLERINPDNPSSDPENWHSASTTYGYATPGFQNSQMAIPDNAWGEITLFPEVFSPDNDGLDDYVTLHLQFHEPGWMATITVFDARGRKIKNLINNNMLGSDEYFIWDGKWADEQPADIGIYVMHVELYSRQGKIKKFKKVVPLVRRL